MLDNLDDIIYNNSKAKEKGRLIGDLPKRQEESIMSLSQNRKKLKGLFLRQEALIPVFLSRKPLIKGGVYKAKTKCGSKGCRCEREGELHEVWRLYRSHKGKSQTRTLKKYEVFKYQKYTQEYRRYRLARSRLVKLHSEILNIVDRIEKEKTRIIKGIK